MSSVTCPNCRFVLAGNKPPHSPVSALLGSNAAPSDSQIIVIRRVIAEAHSDILQLDADIEKVRSVLDQAVKDLQNTHTSSKPLPHSLAGIFVRRKQAEISRLTAEIEQVRALLDQLLTDRWELHAFMKDHCALLSPIRHLCAELLSEIFIQCLPAWGQSDTITPLRAPPWLLGQICSRWRAVALSTPRLWASIDVHVTRKSVIPQGNALETWLARSKAYPLSLSLKISHPPYWDSHPAFDVVLSSCHRWQDVHLSYSAGSAYFHPFSTIDGFLPSLRHLRIGDENVGIPRFVLLTAPQLRILEIKSQGSHDSGLSTCKLPWAQLTHCETEDTSIEDGLEVLHTCQNLVEFTINCTVVTFRSFAFLPRVIRHQQLRRLHITVRDVVAATLFDRLDLPALREVDVGIKSLEPWPQPQFMSFLRRTHGSIEHLTLRLSLTGNELIDCLSEVPALKYLHINEPIKSRYSCSQILTDIVLRRLVSDLAPKLRSISFHGPAFNNNLFSIMVQSRWKRQPSHGGSTNEAPARARLQSVELVLPNQISPQALNRLNRLRREGLNVQISHW